MSSKEFYLKSIWDRTLKAISETHQIDENAFNTYFTQSRLVSLEDTGALVVVPNFIHYSLMNERTDLIEKCLLQVLNESGDDLQESPPVTIIKEDDYNEKTKTETSFTNDFIVRSVDPSFTFFNFVTGRSNAQAHLASMTCANNLGIVYNPLFIYGNSGLGKTHLLNAIGNLVLDSKKNKKVGFISGLDFVEGVSNSIKEKRIDEFKRSFRDLDLLLVDDIQFIAGKEKTHEVFFSVFNDLVNNRKQVVVTADRTPSEIRGLEERIISRFNQGLSVNIEAPEYETSINILKMKISNNIIASDTITIDDEVLSYIASNFSKDVRSLEGAINRLLFYSINFSKEDHISLKLATEAFRDQLTENKNELNISAIRRTVCDYYNLTKQQIVSKNRTKNIANARNIAMYLCRKLLDAPYKDIGNEFGKRDHTTVMSSCDRVEQLIKTDSRYLKAINEIESRIK